MTPRDLVAVAVVVCATSSGRLLSQQAIGSIAGSVRDSDGTPVVRASVNVDHYVSPWFATTDDSGRFLITKVPVGAHVLRVRGSGRLPMTSDSVRVLSNQVTRVGQLVARAAMPQEVWLRCDSAITESRPQMACDTGVTARGPDGLPRGIGVIRSAAAWDRLWAKFGTPGDKGRSARVDWDRYMVVLISYRSTSLSFIERNRFNRALLWPDSVRIELGPDSIAQRGSPAADFTPRPAAIAIQRSDARVVFRRVIDGGAPDWVVNWEALANK